MPLSTEGTKYQQDMIKALTAATTKLQGTQFKSDLELIKTVNMTLTDLAAVRTKHVKH
jgi:hypothetical protein